MAEYNRQSVKRPLEHDWEQARVTIERLLALLDKEYEKIKDVTDSLTPWSDIIIADSTTDTEDYSLLFTEDGEIITI